MHPLIDHHLIGSARLHRALLLLTCGALVACHGEKVASEATADSKVDGDKITFSADAPQKASLVVEPVRSVEQTILHLNGRVVWDDKTTVRVFSSVAGRVQRILVSLKDNVAVDDTLAMMASPDFGQAQADASKADADMKLSERTLTRTRDLFEHGAAAQKDVEAAEDDFGNKQAELQRALARLKLYGVELGASVDGMFPLKTPIGGRIVEKNINPGQEVRPDQMLANDPTIIKPLFVISDPRRLSVLLDVTELDITGLKPGQRLQVRSRAYPNEAFDGTLEVVGDALDPQTRTVYVRGYVDNPDGRLKAEMYVGVDVVGDAGEKSVLGQTAAGDTPVARPAGPPVEIPVKAVFSKGDQHYVFVEDSPGQYERKPILLGAEHDGQVRVIDGVVAGQRVVTDGSLQLQAMTEGSKE